MVPSSRENAAGLDEAARKIQYAHGRNVSKKFRGNRTRPIVLAQVDNLESRGSCPRGPQKRCFEFSRSGFEFSGDVFPESERSEHGGMASKPHGHARDDGPCERGCSTSPLNRVLSRKSLLQGTRWVFQIPAKSLACLEEYGVFWVQRGLRIESTCAKVSIIDVTERRFCKS